MTYSNIEFAPLELQRFWGISKNDRDKLRAKSIWRWCRCHPRVPQPTCPAAHVPRSQALRPLQHPPHRWGFCTIRSLPSACRRRVAPLMVQFPRLVVWSRFEVVSRPKCRPPRRKTPTMGSRGRGRLRWQHNDAWPRASLAHSPLRCEREPAIACANQLFRTLTRYSVSGRGCPRSY